MSKLITKLLHTQPKSLVCKLLGSPDTKSVNLRRDSDVKHLQRQVKKQFGSNVRACDLKLFPALDKLSDRWLRCEDKAMDALSKGETAEEVGEMMHASSEIGFHSRLRTLFDSAPQDDSVVHILAKECPVHRVRAARWKSINNTLKDLLPTWIVLQHEYPPPPKEWLQLYEDAYEPQLKPYKETVAPVDTETLDDLAACLTQSPGYELIDVERKLYMLFMIDSCTSKHPDLGFATRKPLDGFRVDYHVYAPCVVMYERVPKLVIEYNCDDVQQGIARVLTACEVVADNNGSDEVFGAVVTEDLRWIFLRSLDNKILIDDDVENRLEWDEDGRPDRKNLAKIIGKLHGMIMEGVPAAEPNWRENEED